MVEVERVHMIREEDRSIVVVGAHGPPTGEAGGVMLRCAELGKEVTITCLSHSIFSPLTSEQQEERGRKVADAIGAKNIEYLNFRDTEIQDTIELRHSLVKLYRMYKADIVITESYQNPHPDARGTSYAASYAACHASLEGVLPEVRPVHTVQAVYHFLGYAYAMGFKPDVYVDVTGVAERKYQVLTMQMAEKPPMDQVLSREKVWGMHSGVKYAKAFVSFWTSHLGIRAVTTR